MSSEHLIQNLGNIPSMQSSQSTISSPQSASLASSSLLNSHMMGSGAQHLLSAIQPQLLALQQQQQQQLHEQQQQLNLEKQQQLQQHKHSPNQHMSSASSSSLRRHSQEMNSRIDTPKHSPPRNLSGHQSYEKMSTSATATSTSGQSSLGLQLRKSPPLTPNGHLHGSSSQRSVTRSPHSPSDAALNSINR